MRGGFKVQFWLHKHQIAQERMNAFDIRRENLSRIVLNGYGGNRAAFSRKAGVHQNQVNLLLTDNMEHRRNLGEALARRMEEALGLPTGQLDVSPVEGADAETTVRALPLDGTLRNALKPTTFLHGAVIKSSWLDAFDSRITAVQNVGLAEIATDDMAPDLHVGDNVLIDTGATTVAVDGVYLLTRDDDAFVRRVQKQLDGGFMITADPSRHQPLKVENMKRFRVLGRVLLAVGARRV